MQDKFGSIIEEYAREIAFAVLLVLSVLIRVDLSPKIAWSGDYLYCIAPWVDDYRNLGVAGGLAVSISNYYIPYNIVLALIAQLPMDPWVMVSILSCAMEYVGVYYAYKILDYLSAGRHSYRAMFAAVGLLYLPPMMLNGALWKQCDAVYSAFALIALYNLLKDRYFRAFLFLGIAFVFKLQVILLFPIFILAWFCEKRYNLLLWLEVPAMYLLAGLPAILCGRPADEVYRIYLNQSNEYHHMFMNTGNLWRLFRSDYEALHNAGIYAAIAFLTVMWVFVVLNRSRMNLRRLLQAAGVSAYGCFLFLPAMHERYDYLALILLFIYYAFYDRRRLYIPGAMVAVTTVMYCEYLFGGNTLPEEAYALMCIGAFALAAKDFAEALLPTGSESGKEEYVDQDK